MDYLAYVLFVYFILNGGFTTINCAKSKSRAFSRNTKKIVGVIQLISGLSLSVIINQVFPERNTMFWIAFIAVIMILICGCINLFLYMCSVE